MFGVVSWAGHAAMIAKGKECRQNSDDTPVGKPMKLKDNIKVDRRGWDLKVSAAA